MRKGLIAGAVGLVVAAAVIVPLTVTSGPSSSPTLSLGLPSPGTFITPPTMGGDLGCGADQTSALRSFFDGLPNGSTVKFRHDACYTVNNTLRIDGATGLTINGNNATINQAVPVSSGFPGGGPPHAVLFLTDDTNVTITDLNVVGAWDGTSSDHGEFYEGGLGISFEGDTNVTFTGGSVVGPQGDAVDLPTPAASGVPANAINQNITLSNTQVTDAGYTGLGVESVVGLNVTNDTFNGVAQNAIDFEVDDAGTFFANPTAPPGFAVQSRVLIAGDTFKNFAFGEGNWFSSIQGGVSGTPTSPPPSSCPSNGNAVAPIPGCTYYGVQQQNVTLSGNTIYCNANRSPSPAGTCPLVVVIGTHPGACCTPAGKTFDNRFLNINLTVTGNRVVQGVGISTTGGASGSAMTFKNVSNLTITNNRFPLFTGTTTAAVTSNNAQVLTIKNNVNPGAVATLNPTDS